MDTGKHIWTGFSGVFIWFSSGKELSSGIKSTKWPDNVPTSKPHWYIDDATNHTFGRFYEYEGVYPAMDSLSHYIKRYGLPQSIYLDKFKTYKASRKPTLYEELRGEGALSQYQRALKELGIRIIHADSPQAKGRVERLFGTLQDRLIKEMRLARIKTIEKANEFLNDYLPGYNEKIHLKYLKAATEKDITPGIIAVIQSFGSRINFHPHLHFLVTEGGADKQGRFHKVSGFNDSLLCRFFTR